MTDILPLNGDVDAFILEADGTVDANHGYGYLIAKRLAAFNVKTQLISLEKDADKLTQLPKKPLFISGGMTEVTAEVDWVIEVRNFLRETIHKNEQTDSSNHHAIFGICFGAQIIAESYRKGSVVYLDKPEIGETQVTVNDPHPLFKGFHKTFPAYTFHYNQIKPHKDFSLIAQNHYKGHTFTQVFEIPKASCFGVQFHPEFSYEEFQTLVKTYTSLLRILHQDPEEILKSLPEIPHNAGLLYNFFQFYSKQED